MCQGNWEQYKGCVEGIIVESSAESNLDNKALYIQIPVKR